MEKYILTLMVVFGLGCGNPVSKELKGASSGGGGYVDKNSLLLLEKASLGLRQQINRSSSSIYSSLPNGWTQAQIADRLAFELEGSRDLRLAPNKSVVRNNRELMFDYGRDERSPRGYIEVLQPFFISYASVPVKQMTEKELEKILVDIREKLLHEIAHLVFGHTNQQDQQEVETEAEQFSLAILNALRDDFITCKVRQEEANFTRFGPWHYKICMIGTTECNEEFRKITLHLAIHRPTGNAIFNSSSEYDKSTQDLIYENESPEYLNQPYFWNTYNWGEEVNQDEVIFTLRSVLGQDVQELGQFETLKFNDMGGLTFDGIFSFSGEYPEVISAGSRSEVILLSPTPDNGTFTMECGLNLITVQQSNL